MFIFIIHSASGHTGRKREGVKGMICDTVNITGLNEKFNNQRNISVFTCH